MMVEPTEYQCRCERVVRIWLALFNDSPHDADTMKKIYTPGWKLANLLSSLASIPKKHLRKKKRTAPSPARMHPFEFLYGTLSSHEPHHQKVAVVSCTSYDKSEVLLSVRKALDDIGFQIPKKVRVLIKPNVVAQYTPSQAATTHPAVVDALCQLCAEAKCSITIGDSSAFYQRGGTQKSLVMAGMTAVAKKYGATILPFEKAPLRKVSAGESLKNLWITNAVFEHDIVINVPKLKVHGLDQLSGAIKNMYGCIPGGTKQVYRELFQYRHDYHDFWGEPLVDVYTVTNPDLTIMDAVYGLEKNGPFANGVSRYAGTIIASTNGVLVDVAACTMIGTDPKSVPAIRVAIERGIADDRSMEIIGTLPNIPFAKSPPVRESRFSHYLYHHTIMKPAIAPSKCAKACSHCVSVCKPGAISLNSKKEVEIDYHRCIRCYCCVEQCPHKAIRLQGSLLNKVIQVVRRLRRV